MKKVVIIALVHSVAVTWGQSAGNKSFQFLNIPAHARLAALGGVNTSLADQDVNFAFTNPALAGDTLAGYASAGYLFYLADIGQATFSYAHDFSKAGTVIFGVRHINYGEVAGYDVSGMETGIFQSGETELLIGKSHQVGAFRLGANIKGVFSNLAGFRGTALLTDVGGIFIHPKKHLVAGMVFRNLGFVLNEFSETSNSDLPFDIQIGATSKPEHMPVRFSTTLFNLANLGKAYRDQSLVTEFFRHLNVGAELLIHKNVNVLVGYNGLRQQELQVPSGPGMRGFSVGFLVRVKQFECALSRASYSVGNATYAFTLNVNTKSMLMKRKEI